MDVLAQREAKIFRGAQIERIDQRDAERVVAHADRQRAMQPREAGRNQAQDFRRDFVFGKIDESVPSASAMTW